jgi:uncharacterized repeat protein (TIGR03803 family)
MQAFQRRLLICSAGLLLFEAAFTSAVARNADIVLYAFQGSADGSLPAAGLIADKSGNLYGTTYFGGGGSGCGPSGCGTVFEIAPDGAEAVLYAFKGDNDGAYPQGGLVTDRAGNYYGTTTQGGASASGTIFELAPDGTEVVLHTFTGGRDGYYPTGNLITDTKGSFYGTTEFGGDMNNAECNYDGCGTVFEIKPNRKKITLHVFRGGNDGIAPAAGLVSDASGSLYGTTSGGGGDNCSTGCGVVFKITPQGRETILYAFQGGSDGSGPVADLTIDAAGNLYGTTSYGGVGGASCPEGALGCGTVFKIAPDGSETVLYAFQGGNDGWSPYAGVLLDPGGNLYGTTYFGGGTGCAHQDGCGTVFKLAPDGREAVVYALQDGIDGGLPDAGLLAGKNGVLYGTASEGGDNDNGVVFRVKK